ncbi:MAG: hypothetical protein M1826_000996 [Phylliscum demangeonii]|nr:MAG: hypothetical protein M1826_000996 [Phylliscum demangeonii]
MPSISAGGSCATALDGGQLFACRLNAVTGRSRDLPGRSMSAEARETRALGCDHTCDRRASSQSASILWRTNRDRENARPFSGSVLCLSRIPDATARAVVFQNYEAPTQEARDVRGAFELGASFKGGFLLPPEVRLEVATDFESQPLPHPLPASKRASADDGQRRH